MLNNNYTVKQIKMFYELIPSKGLQLQIFPDWDNPNPKCLYFPWLQLNFFLFSVLFSLPRNWEPL